AVRARLAAAPTLNDLIDAWLKQAESRIKATSLSTYRSYAKKQIRPYLGDIPANKLTEDMVLAFLAQVSSEEKGFAKKTVQLIANILKQVLTFGKKYGITVDPAICVIRGKQGSQRTANTLNAVDCERLLETLGNCERPSDLAIYLSLKTGLRVGELAGLMWGDVDFDAGFLKVRRTVSRIYREDGTSTVHIGEPKSESSIRRVPLTPAVTHVLARHRQEDEVYVTSGRRKPQETGTLQQHFKVVLRRAGIRDINFHALRHTFATRCVEKGFDVKSLSLILGHSDVSVTLNTYVHPSMEKLRSMMESLE
ncbi:MAG: site-specific integrase, partial [Clostridiales bacterium]|nr:site-specific integrase [Clostridiales bacterium]